MLRFPLQSLTPFKGHRPCGHTNKVINTSARSSKAFERNACELRSALLRYDPSKRRVHSAVAFAFNFTCSVSIFRRFFFLEGGHCHLGHWEIYVRILLVIVQLIIRLGWNVAVFDRTSTLASMFELHFSCKNIGLKIWKKYSRRFYKGLVLSGLKKLIWNWVSAFELIVKLWENAAGWTKSRHFPIVWGALSVLKYLSKNMKTIQDVFYKGLVLSVLKKNWFEIEL